MESVNGPHFYTLNAFLQEKYGERVQRIPIDAGFDCPNRDGKLGMNGCSFCDEKGSGSISILKNRSVTDQIRAGIKFMESRYHARKFIAYFQAFTNTYAPVSRLRELYMQALDVPGVLGLSIGTRPDCVDNAVLDLLEELAETRLVILEFGVQSMNDRVLRSVGRGHGSLAVRKAISESKKRRGIHVVAHLIFGLPGEKEPGMLEGAEQLVQLGVDGFKINHLYITRGTAMAEDRNLEKISLLTREVYCGTLMKLISSTPRDIVFHRLFGYCPPENLIGPLWTLDKNRNILALEKMMIEHGIYQGDRRNHDNLLPG